MSQTTSRITKKNSLPSGYRLGLFIVAIMFLVGCQSVNGQATQKEDPSKSKWAAAIFAGGCFWCMEPPFDKLPGVKATISGYTGGSQNGPSYRQVAYGRTTHLEAVLVYFDSKVVNYERLLEVFWRNIDPTQGNGQFVDIGPHYRSAIFYLNNEQKNLAQKSKAQLAKSGRFTKPIVTEIRPAADFWRAEEYHQDFYKKDPAHYYRYRKGSGRDQFIEKVWGPKQE